MLQYNTFLMFQTKNEKNKGLLNKNKKCASLFYEQEMLKKFVSFKSQIFQKR